MSSEDAAPTADSRPAGSRRPGYWALILLSATSVTAGALWGLRVDRDPRLFGDWYSPGGMLFRFQPDGTFQSFLPSKNGLTRWSVHEWSTEGDVIRKSRSASSRWRHQWEQLVLAVQRSNVQIVRLNIDSYRVIEWGESALKLQRISQQPHRVPPVEVFTRTPPTARSSSPAIAPPPSR